MVKGAALAYFSLKRFGYTHTALFISSPLREQIVWQTPVKPQAHPPVRSLTVSEAGVPIYCILSLGCPHCEGRACGASFPRLPIDWQRLCVMNPHWSVCGLRFGPPRYASPYGEIFDSCFLPTCRSYLLRMVRRSAGSQLFAVAAISIPVKG